MALSRLVAKHKDEDYSPVVSSPLNPESCYQTQTSQQQKSQRRITLAGRPTSKPRSPTQLLLRNKAAVAFQHHAIAVGKSREHQDMVWAVTGDIRAGRRISSSHLLHVGMDRRTLRCPTKISSKTNCIASTITPPPVTRPLFPAPVGVSFDSIADSASDEMGDFDMEDKDDIQLLTLHMDGDEFKVDFSGVTIDSITTTMILPRTRAIWELWATPGRLLFGAVIFCCLLLLFFVKIEALFSHSIMP